MKFKNFYITEVVSDWMNTLLEDLAVPQSYKTRKFADNVTKAKTPAEFKGMKLRTFDHGQAGQHNMILTFAFDGDDRIKYIAYGSEINPQKIVNAMSGDAQEDKEHNVLYQRSVAKDEDGHISTKEIAPPFI